MNPQTSKTPRTDALENAWANCNVNEELVGAPTTYRDFARQLEIENQELREDLAAKMERLNQFLATRPKR